ncbi:MAG: hypothetical protein AB7Q23_01720 [Hyphomonadaceae bacterium]
MGRRFLVRWLAVPIALLTVSLLIFQNAQAICAATGLFCSTANQVDAVYYPDRNNLLVYERVRDVGSVEACRVWVRERAADYGDPNIVVGTYECGIGPIREISENLTVYQSVTQ